MEIPNKKEAQKIAFNHSSNTDFREFMSLYTKCTAKPYSLLVIGTTLALGNLLHFRNNIVERI